MPTTDIRISSSADDVEERISGSVNFASSDLEMADDKTKHPGQTIGLRFNGLDIPQGAIITNAYIQFQVDETNSGAATLQIHGEDTDNATAFADAAFDVSSRQSTTATVTWTPPDWTTIGAAGVDQQSADISSIIQEIISRPGWTQTNSIALMITGSGQRTAESYDGSAAAAPLLHIEFELGGPPSDPVVFDVPADTNGAADQIAELAAAGTSVGITASASDPDPGDTVSYSIDDTRFAIDASTGVITRSGVGTLDFETEPSIDVIVTATSSDFSTDTQVFTITVDDENEAPVVASPIVDTVAVQDEAFNHSVAANFADEDTSHGDVLTYGAELAAGGALPSWLAIDANTGAISGTPTAADLGSIDVTVTANDTFGPLSVSDTFTINVIDNQAPPTILDTRISSSADDVEERASGRVKFNSSDLELVDDNPSQPGQTIGLRFNGLNIPQGAIITNAHIQFQADEVDIGAVSLQIHGNDADNATAFTNTTFDVSSRSLTTAVVTWTPPDWTTTGDAGTDQQTADIASIIQEIIDRPGWTPTNSIALIITGSGQRTAEAYDGVAAAAPLLHIEFQPGGPPSDPVVFDVPADTNSNADQIDELATVGTSVGITASATDPDPGDTVSYSIDDVRFAIDAASGIITRSGIGTLDFESEPSIDVTVTATSSDFSIDTQVFTITVNDDNELPVANNDSATTQVDLPIVIEVLANDNLGDGLDNITSSTTSLQGGTVVNNGDGTFNYTPPATFAGADSFDYTITDINGPETSTATVAITVNASQPPSSVTLQQAIITGENGAWWPSSYSSDPAGIVYIAHNQYQSMLIADSEINEMPIYNNENLFFFNQTGGLIETSTTFPDFSDEPTGVTYNPNNLHLYFSDDTSAGNGKRIYDVDPGSDGLYFTSDDPVVTSFRTSDFGSNDPEGLAYDTTRDVLYVIDGVTDQLFTVDPGLDGSFVNDADNVVSSFDIGGLGVLDPEGVAYDEVFDLLYIIGRKSDDTVHQVDPVTGALVGEIDITAANVKSGAGLAIGPSSVSGLTSLWIADRGVDNDSDPNENDGVVHELSFDGWIV